MAKRTVHQKARRVLDLLLGLRHPRIAAALAAYGFTDADVAEGFSLLQAIVPANIDAIAALYEPPPHTVHHLDTWENQWFPVARATLQNRAPEVGDWLFQNLSQTEGPQVVLSVKTFVDRFERLTKSKKDGGYGPGGKEAKAILEKRGLSPSVIDEAKALLRRIIVFVPPPPGTGQPPSFTEAEVRLWAWYLEWSEIARIAIKDRTLLRALGFLKDSRGKSDQGEDDSDDSNEGTAG